jgi:putative redox protein
MAMLEAKVAWLEGMEVRGEDAAGHVVAMDAREEFGGRNRGFLPMELLLNAVGGCTAMDVISLLRKMQQNFSAYEVNVKGERAADHPRVFTDITIEHVVYGQGLNEDSVRRAVDLSHNKYCSAIAMMSKAANVISTYRIVVSSE